ncbi:MAG: Tol-Pal system beta propeller repeat protein TolB [Candidatus Hydrogenedentota bacterium]
MRVFVVFLLTLAAAPWAGAQQPVQIELDRPMDRRIPIAVPPFAAASGHEELGRELAEVMEYDLEFSGHFQIVPRSEFPPDFQGFTDDPTEINFSGWREDSSAEYLVYARVRREGEAVVAECRLFDVIDGVQVVGKRLSTDNAEWARQVAHQFADEIVLYLTGELGIATSQIAFSQMQDGNKEIFVADYDGHRQRAVTNHSSVSIRPKISPSGDRIAYVSYKDRYPFLYILNLSTGESAPLSQRVGLNASPSWEPDGESLAIVLSVDGHPNIYLIDADGSNLRQLTHEKVVDSSPAFHPSGERIAFVSERSGPPQIFVMDRDGGNVRRMSFQGGSAYDPAWSPNGQYLAYVAARSGEGYHIYAMEADGSNPQRLTSTGRMNESPSWSADSRHIIFTSNRGGQKQLWTVNVETGDVRQVPNLGNAPNEGPNWGPRRHPSN